MPSPNGRLLNQIVVQWGSFNAFIEQFQNSQTKLFGSGWVWACVNSGGNIEIRSTTNQINPLMGVSGSICYPFLGNDLWEHSYYLKYMWDRSAYVTSFLNAIDWETVSIFYELYASKGLVVPL